MADPNPAPDLLTFQTMYLCGVAYMLDPALMPRMIEKTQVPPPGTAVWRCLWGPAQNDDDANLVFVAGYFPDSNAAPESIFVTIRGTDVDIDDVWGILWQIWEDLDAGDPQPMPWALQDPARVASGTLDGLTTIQGLADFSQPADQETLTQFLTTFLSKPENASVSTVVTGHSLGGCLATIVAMWIRTLPLPNYRGTIQPITFAAPTAGNTNFASYCDSLFPSARRFQNTLDIIPLLYYDLAAIDGIYGGSLPTPDLAEAGVAIMQKEIGGASYAQPARGQQILPGTLLACDTDWYAQAFHQHHLATYLAILTGKPVDPAALPQPNAARAKKARLLELIGAAGAAPKGK